MRFVLDRGYVSAELACLNSPDSWQPLERVLAALDIVGRPEGPITVDAAAELLTRYLGAIEAKMCTPGTRARLVELEAAATRVVLAGLELFKPKE